MKILVLLLFILPSLLFSEEKGIVDYLFGPRTGFTYVFTTQEEFDTRIQTIYPNVDKTYFPFFTQFGLMLEQRIKLGDTSNHFAFQEVILIGGIDQSIVIPSISFAIGFRHHNGLEFGLGPNLSITTNSNEEMVANISVVYTIGWTFSYENVFVPVNIAVVPTPIDGKPRFSVLTGFNFFI